MASLLQDGDLTFLSAFDSGFDHVKMAADGNGKLSFTCDSTQTHGSGKCVIQGIRNDEAADSVPTKAYVDAIRNGLTVREPVHAATDIAVSAAIDLSAQTITSSEGGSAQGFAALFPNVDTNDINVPMRFLVKDGDGTDNRVNGIYRLSSYDSSTTWTLTRATPENQGGEFIPGMSVHVDAGKSADSVYVLTSKLFDTPALNDADPAANVVLDTGGASQGTTSLTLAAAATFKENEGLKIKNHYYTVTAASTGTSLAITPGLLEDVAVTDLFYRGAVLKGSDASDSGTNMDTNDFIFFLFNTAGTIAVSTGSGLFKDSDSGEIKIRSITDDGDHLRLATTKQLQFGASTEYIANAGANSVELHASGDVKIQPSVPVDQSIFIGDATSGNELVFGVQMGSESDKSDSALNFINALSTETAAIAMTAGLGGIEIEAGLTAAISGTTVNINGTTGGVSVLATGGTLALDGQDSTNLSMTADSGDAKTLTIAATNASAAANVSISAGDAVTMTATAGAMTLSAGDTTNLTMTADAAETKTMTIACTNSTEGQVSNLDIDADGVLSLDGAGGIDIGKTTDVAIDVDASTFDLDCSGAMSLNSSGGAINIGDDNDAHAINIGTGDAARTITVGNSTDGTAVVLTANGAPSNFTLTSTADDDDLTIAQAGGTNSSLILSSTGTGADALQVTASAGGMDIKADGEMDITTSDNNSDITINPHGSGTLALGSASNTAVTADALAITLTSVNALTLTDGTASLALDGDGATSLSGGTTVSIGGSGEITIDSSGAGVSIDAAAASNFTTSAGLLTLTGATGIEIGGSGVAMTPATDGGIDLGSSAKTFADLYLKSTGVIDFGSNVTLTHDTDILKCNKAFRALSVGTLSDKKYKKNIKTIGNPIDTIMSMRGVEWDWKDNVGSETAAGTRSSGVVAQELRKVMPHAIFEEKDGLTVNYNAMTGVLIEAIKAQQVQIEELKKLSSRKRIVKTGTI